MTAEAVKDKSGSFRVVLKDDEGEIISPIQYDKDKVEIGREEGVTIKTLIDALGGSETLDDMPLDGGGFGEWRAAERLASRIESEIYQAVAAKRKGEGNGKSKRANASSGRESGAVT